MAFDPPSPGPSSFARPPGTSDHKSDSQHSKVVAAAGAVGVAVMLSRLTGLFREAAFAGFFGAGVAYDAYLGAFRIPNLFRDLLAEGALSSAFVAVFSRRSRRGPRARCNSPTDSRRRWRRVAFVCLLGAVFAPQVVDLMFPGFAQVEGKKELTVLLTRIMMPFLLFASLAAKAMGALQANDRFLIPSLSSAVFNVTSLTIGLAFAFWIAPAAGLEPIVGMAAGALLGGAFQWRWQVPGLRQLGMRYRPDFEWRDPGCGRCSGSWGLPCWPPPFKSTSSSTATSPRSSPTRKARSSTVRSPGSATPFASCNCRWDCLAWRSVRRRCRRCHAAPPAATCRSSETPCRDRWASSSC